MRFAKQNPFQSYKTPSSKRLSRILGSSLTKHAGQLSNLQLLFLLLLKRLDLLANVAISEH